MQVKSLSVAWLIGAGSLGACLFTACNGDADLVPAPSGPSAGAGGESHGPGSAECEAMGHLCHDADTGSGPASECHETGHVGDAEACSDAFESCIDTCVPAGGGEAGGSGHRQGAYCRALGSYCHDADTGSGRGHECHNIGHAGDEEACVEEFEGCISFCKEALEEAGEGGAGGVPGNAGGQGGAHEAAAGGHAGSQEHGGAAGAHESTAGHAGG